MVRMLVMQIFDPAKPDEVLYLQAYDPDRNRYAGHIELTPHKAQAMQFADFSRATEVWRQTSRTMPTRPDGRPNRPLTAFSASFVDAA
jgi:hypothetical protein